MDEEIDLPAWCIMYIIKIAATSLETRFSILYLIDAISKQ